ncbi:MAG: GTP cyclohydrolase I FolE2 [Synergistaceae bacterium]|nr:GTP cyclohydrolase I FolE2 [Synergistaceae bacterium]
MRDVQSEKDPRNISIDRVGVRNVHYPVLVMDRQEGTQPTVASVSMSVLLPHEHRGTHMSRFIEALERYRGLLSPTEIESIVQHLRERLEASEASIRLDFPYFIRKAAPVSGIESSMRYEASLEGSSRATEDGGESFDLLVGVRVPVQTLCPCSKEISRHGAHDQRALVSLKVRCSSLVWFEELIGMAEDAASSPLFTLLKREDEKYVTERAYDHPRFVEDVARELAVALDAEPRVIWYSISIVSYESIHAHDAFAEIARDKRR